MIFVLGIERSATTWVSNILDMHPGTALYMEPLSKNTSRFKKWPHRFVKINDLSTQARYFNTEFDYLKKRKRFLFNSITDADWAWRCDIKISQKFWDASARARDFFELNFNRMGTSGYPAKQTHTVEIIKELRLNYNVPLLKHIHPGVKVVVVLRNYAANVQSVVHQIHKGNLSELAELLQDQFGKINEQTIFDYWAESYNQLFNELEAEQIPHFVVRQDDLIQSGKETVDGLLSFLDLASAPSVYNYLSRSNDTGGGKHSTKRDHNAIMEQNRQAENKLRPQLATQIDEINWHPVLRKEIKKL